MKINPYLFFNGRCEEAFKFYQKVLGGNIEAMMSHEGTPAQDNVPVEWHKKIMHACLKIGDGVLMASDAPPEHYKAPQGFSVSIQTDDPAEAERIFQAFSEGGTVRMELQQTFWARRFGMVADQFGTPWMINCP